MLYNVITFSLKTTQVMATAGEPEKLAKIKNNLILDMKTEKVSVALYI